ncbi:hypothetical protein BpHYR1_027644 [Brachionus plicatilis]|uniref:Uncharacterized protein n=1 Tax=Brachionus plicatilis TaxID=10195 RepID=A0A3M7S3Q8_BRAPC|nr:hypothetical protein BpHYR1_027644 [Brachionus plicatilis]
MLSFCLIGSLALTFDCTKLSVVEFFVLTDDSGFGSAKLKLDADFVLIKLGFEHLKFESSLGFLLKVLVVPVRNEEFSQFLFGAATLFKWMSSIRSSGMSSFSRKSSLRPLDKLLVESNSKSPWRFCFSSFRPLIWNIIQKKDIYSYYRIIWIMEKMTKKFLVFRPLVFTIICENERLLNS